MNIDDYAKLIFSKESFILEKTRELDDYLTDISNNIFNNPKQRKNRSFEHVYTSVKKMVVEHALVQKNIGFVHNPLPWDYKVPHSHAYDLIHENGCKTFELKRWPPNKPDGSTAEWFSYPYDAIGNFRKHLDIIGYLVGAKMVEHKDCYEVGYHMIADAKTFFSYTKRGMYEPTDLVYYHRDAIKDGNCITNHNVKYRSK
jgi:hypothetical protein